MFQINENYLKLQGSYLFSTIAAKIRAYTELHPDNKIIRLGIGDVTLPLAPAVISALHTAVDEMAVQETFRGYAPDLGYEFLRSAICANDFRSRRSRLRMTANAATASAAWPWQVAGEMLKWVTDGEPEQPLIPIAVGEDSIAFPRRSVKAGVD